MQRKAAVVENPSPPSKLSLPIATSICWDCKSEHGGSYYCQQCVKIQPLSKEGDYFEYFGVPRLFNLDLDQLESRYYMLSRKFHPDFYGNKSAVEQSISLGNSAVLNTAYQTLKNQDQRVQYLLELEAGAWKTTQTTLSEGLFDELMEIQDTITSFKQASDPHRKKTSMSCDHDQLYASKTLLEEKHNALSSRLQALSLKWDHLVLVKSSISDQIKVQYDMDREAILIQIRNIVSDQSYITRVLTDINTLISTT